MCVHAYANTSYKKEGERQYGMKLEAYKENDSVKSPEFNGDENFNITLLLSTKASHYWGEGVVLLDMNLHNK
jgi:hypothetical protein